MNFDNADVTLILNGAVKFTSSFSSRCFWLHNDSKDAWGMFPLDSTLELAFFGYPDSSLMFSFNGRLQCVSVPTKLSIARKLADELGIELEMMGHLSPEEEAEIQRLVARDMAKMERDFPTKTPPAKTKTALKSRKK